MKIKKIINPVDGSGHSIHSTRYAVEMARMFGSTIILLHCHGKFPALMSEPYFQEAINKINAASEQLVKPFVKQLEESGVPFEVLTLEGSPGDKIPEIAKIEKADLIVMGSRGVGDFAGLFLGSVAHQVLHKAQCPVFITK